MSKVFAIFGASLAALGVLIGAFGAHALKERLNPESLAIFEVGVRYQMYHALGLFAIAWFSQHYSSKLFSMSGWLMIAGILFFSGSLYLLSLTSIKAFGAVTPIGGVFFLIAWILLGVGVWLC